jgi:molybdate transport system permease protein
MNIDLGPLWLSFKLGLVSVLFLLLIGTPAAWWLATTRNRLRPALEAIVALPLVLPPTVLGFYLLMLLGPNGLIGRPFVMITDRTLTFSFSGLVIASVCYSLPFVVQPLQSSFQQIGNSPLEAASVLRASRLDAFFSVICPLAHRGFLTASVLGFAHTLGEFGVVLMVGGSIPGVTKVVSIAIYEHVETLDYRSAHTLSAILLVFSFLVLLLVYWWNRRPVRSTE